MEQVEWVDIGAAVLWTVRSGHGPPLVLCHGGPGACDTLGPVAAMVADLVQVHRYDQRACGRSSGGPPFDMRTAIADLEALRRHWGHDRWVVGGHSFGASLALAYCLEHAEHAQALLYLSGTGIDPRWHTEYRANRLARLTADQQHEFHRLREMRARAQEDEKAAAERAYWTLSALTDFADSMQAPALVEQRRREELPGNDEVNRLLGQDATRYMEAVNMAERLRELALPALIVHGDGDPRPLWAAAQMADLLPQGRLVVLPGVGHFPWLERPHLLAAALRAFLVAS